MSEGRLSEMLHRVAAESRPPRLAADTWDRGRRRRRFTVAAAVVAVTALLAGVPLAAPRLHAAPAPADGGGRRVVPARVYPPLPGQNTIGEDPPGPAALVVSGDRELQGSDLWTWEGRSLLVGQDGGYRLARTVNQTSAGVDDMLLSPDGRYLAAQPMIEGTNWPDDPVGQTAVVDLTTGRIRQYTGGLPVAWSPDGRSLLLRPMTVDDPRLGRLNLLDVTTGTLRALPEIKERFHSNLAAFAPDGTRIALATTDALYVVETAGMTLRRLAPLTPRDRLAGPGAWLPGGDRITMWALADCEAGETCDEDRLARRPIRFGYRDATTGAVAPGPALPAARGLAARVLGWQRDGDAVVAEYQPEAGLMKQPDDPHWSETDWYAVGSVTVSEFRPDGSRRRVVDLPQSALFVDVPTDLLDSFGGPAPSRAEGAVRWLLALWWPLGQFAGALVVLSALGVLCVRRLRRRARRRAARLG